MPSTPENFKPVEAFNPSDIEIEVVTTYLPRHSRPDEGHYTFAYTITITNHGTQPVQLRSRYWRITDSEDAVNEVSGEGVVGEQPLIAPGTSFRYTSGTNLATPVGYMEGAYYFSYGEDSKEFEAPIPAFSLHTPTSIH